MNSYKNGNTKDKANRIVTFVKVTIPVIIICLILGLSNTALASGTFRVTAGVHVRESASAASKSLTTVPVDSSIDVLEHDPAGWSKVKVGSVTGYIRSDFIKLTIGETPATFRTTAGVHVRETASTSAKSLTVVFLNDSVSVLEHDPAGWSKVQVGDKTGYIRSDFLKHAGTGSSSSSADPATPIGQKKIVGNVNMRAGGAVSYDVIKTLSDGDIVDVLSNEANGWSKVDFKGTNGYIRTDLLSPVAPENTQTDTQTRYTKGNVNFRTSPSAATTANIIRSLSNGTAVEVISNDSNGWSKVIHDGTEGYIKTEYLVAGVAQGATSIRYTDGNVNFRKGASMSSSVIRTLPNATEVTVLANESNGWSSVTHGDTPGYIKTELLLESPSSDSGKPVGVMKVIAKDGANVRTGPSATSDKAGPALPFGTLVNVIAHESNGWSRVMYEGKERYIKTELLGSNAVVEYVHMSEVSHLLPIRENIRVVDVRTGISYNIKIFSKGAHADYEPSTKEDTDKMFAIRSGVKSWSARPIWVYVGGRVFAAATHGMPHDVTWIKDNGTDGHLCLHFKDTVTANKSYQADLRAAVQEAYDKR